MTRIEKSIDINAPVDAVFSFFEDPINLLEIWPSLIDVKDIKKLPNGQVSDWQWEYKMAGMHFDGKGEVTEFVPNQRLITKAKGGIESTHMYTFKAKGDGTKLNLDVEYKVPIPLIGRVAERFIVKLNEQEADSFLSNLKARMEN